MARTASGDQGQGPGDHEAEPVSPRRASSPPSGGGQYPAIDVDGLDGDFLLALVDDFEPSAVDTHESVVTIFFPDTNRRDLAREAVVRAHPEVKVCTRDIDDEDWARRSQENLTPITVGRITVSPPWGTVARGQREQTAPDSGLSAEAEAKPESPSLVTIVIAPSMGFGTGHHATTRLCLRALQTLDLRGLQVLDVGTGSGVLAIAARTLGAAGAIGIDNDPDAIQAATGNLALNRDADGVRFEVRELRRTPLARADVITANLTGALLTRTADLLLNALNPRGCVIVSGLQIHERDEVVGAFGRASVAWEATEEEWVGLIFRQGREERRSKDQGRVNRRGKIRV